MTFEVLPHGIVICCDFTCQIAVVSIVFSIYRTVTVGDTLQVVPVLYGVEHTAIHFHLQELLNNPSQYANFESLGFWQMQFNYMVAVLLFFAWFKVRVEYFSFV